MNPFEFLNNAIVNVLTGLTESYGTRSPNYPVPQPRSTMRDIPFGPYQPLINEAEEVVRKLNDQTRRKEDFIRKELRGY
jgi:hypothetical protein